MDFRPAVFNALHLRGFGVGQPWSPMERFGDHLDNDVSDVLVLDYAYKSAMTMHVTAVIPVDR
jgi:hypothetical protein